VKTSQRSSVTKPTRRPTGVNRASALSMRKCSRNSARDVNMRYGSSAPLVMRSSIKNPGIPFGPANHHSLFPAQPARRVDPGNQSLTTRLFIPRRPVDLPGQIQTLDRLHRQRMIQFPRVDRVILDGVPRPNHLRLLQPGNRRHYRHLHIDRHARRHAIQVHLVSVQSLGLQKNLVTRLIGNLTILSSIDGQYRGPTPSICPLYSGDRGIASRRMRRVSAVV
jgi:hypothetical protein